MTSGNGSTRRLNFDNKDETYASRCSHYPLCFRPANCCQSCDGTALCDIDYNCERAAAGAINTAESAGVVAPTAEPERAAFITESESAAEPTAESAAACAESESADACAQSRPAESGAAHTERAHHAAAVVIACTAASAFSRAAGRSFGAR